MSDLPFEVQAMIAFVKSLMPPHDGMTIGEVKAYLKTLPQDRHVRLGWDECYCDRGHYEKLGLNLETHSQVSQMLEILEQATGKTFTGYKGGDFLMTDDSYCTLNTASNLSGCVFDQAFLETMCKDSWKDN